MIDVRWTKGLGRWFRYQWWLRFSRDSTFWDHNEGCAKPMTRVDVVDAAAESAVTCSVGISEPRGTSTDTVRQIDGQGPASTPNKVPTKAKTTATKRRKTTAKPKPKH